MISGLTISLIAWGVILLFVVLGFLIGCWRGLRRSLFFTIIYIVVIVLSIVLALVLSKSIYNAKAIWGLVKDVIPAEMTKGADGINTVKEFVRFYIQDNFTQVLDSGMTAGESIVNNAEAMALIDGLIIMALRIALVLVLYIVLNIVFYLLFGLIYLMFLRPKTLIETTTTTDEEGNETQEEREIKPKKRRLWGGLCGGVKGFIKSMVLLIPISSMIGVIATLEIPESSSSGNKELGGGDNNQLYEIIQMCKDYDNSAIGKMYNIMSFGSKKGGLDDIIMDSFISIKINGNTKIVLRQELVNLADMYNAIEENIGIDNLDTYDFKANINSGEMVNVVKTITECIGDSKAITTLLSMVDEEAVAIASDKVGSSDPNLHLLFDELDFSEKNPEWWGEQLKQIGDIYESFTEMGIDFTAIDDGNYNVAINGVTTETFDGFVDSLFDNEILDMMVAGACRYAATKLPEDYSTVTTVIDNLVVEDAVQDEIKCFSRLIDIIKQDLKFVDGSLDNNAITLKTLKDIADTNIVADSKLVNNILGSFLKNTLTSLEYDGKNIGVDESLFDNISNTLQTELNNLTKALIDGFGKDYSLADITNISNTAQVKNICNLLESEGLQNCILCQALVDNLLPVALEAVMDSSELEGIIWKNEYKALSKTLGCIFDEKTYLADLGNFNFEELTIEKLDKMSKESSIWSSTFVNKLLNDVVLDFMQNIDLNGNTITIDVDKSKIKWQNEIKAIVEIALACNDGNMKAPISSIADSFGDEIKIDVLNTLSEQIQESKNTIVLHSFANGILKSFFNLDVESRRELPAITNVASTMAVDGAINLNNLSDSLNDGIKDTTLDALKVNTPNSKVLQDVFGDALVSSGRITDKSEIEDWDSELDGLIPVAKTLENSSNVLDLDSLSNITSVKLETIKLLGTSVHKSIVLMNTMAETLSDPMNTDMSSWDSDKWEDEMPHMSNVMATMVTPDTGSDSERVLNISDVELDETSEIKRKTFVALREDVPYSEALQNLFDSVLTDSLYDSENLIDEFPSQPTPYVKDTNYTWWNEEMDGLINVVYTLFDSEDPNSSINLASLADVSSVKVKTIKSLIVENGLVGSADRNNGKTNVGKSLYIQYVFKPELRTLSKRTIDGKEFEFTSGYSWDEEMTGIINLLIEVNTPFDSDGVKQSLSDESTLVFDEIDFNLAKAVGDVTGKQASAKNKNSIKAIAEAINNNTYLQFTVAEAISAMKDINFAPYKDAYDWTNDDWNREMAALSSIADGFMTESNPDFSAPISFKTITTDYDISDVNLLFANVSKSYILQSKLGASLINIGANSSNNVAALTGGQDIINYAISKGITDGDNEYYAHIMAALGSKLGLISSMTTAINYIDDSVIGELSFCSDSSLANKVLTINILTGDVTLGDGSSFYTYPVPTTDLEKVTDCVEKGIMKQILSATGDSSITAFADTL